MFVRVETVFTRAPQNFTARKRLSRVWPAFIDLRYFAITLLKANKSCSIDDCRAYDEWRANDELRYLALS